MLYLDRWIGLVALGLAGVLAMYLFWASKKIDPYRKKSRELYRRHSGQMSDIISNILAVRASAQEEAYINKVRTGAVSEAQSFGQRYTLQAQLIGLRELITVFFFLGLLWLAVERMASGNINLGAAVLVVTYISTLLTGIYSLSEQLDEHDDHIDKIIPALETLERQNLVSDPVMPTPFKKVRGDIVLQNVFFTYHKQPSTPGVLQNVSLHVPPGQKLGIVGLSGAGKSTLTKLLLRFIDLDQGKILIDNVDIRDVLQKDLRANIAYVPQEPLLFHASIQENILLTKPGATPAELEQALKAAHAWTFVEALPEGINSIVGERGVKLSGGQKQRIAIARAVLQNAPIIILDEATSALDSESEQIIKSSFFEIFQGKTAIVIAHRLSTLSDMDRIIVIEKGKVIEDGNHSGLLKQNGVYAALWSKQTGNPEA
jgi:ATP-binding cassette subfamily B protein